MSPAREIVRVFISSTFRDMQAELRHLNAFVFPELRSRCLRRGVDFVGVELRWGVTEEDAERQGALAICLEEIERSRPFFVCVLGHRFGWIPPPEEVPASMFEALRTAGRLPSGIGAWYRLDELADPPMYCLRRDRKIPNEAAETLAHFWESHGLPLAGESITAREILRGAFESGHPPTRAFFYLRRPGLERDAAFPLSLKQIFVEQDRDRLRKLAAVKRRIWRARHETVVRRYSVQYAGPGSESENGVALEGLEAFGERILEDLWPAIEAEIERPGETLDAHERDRSWHERFVIDRTRFFLGRSNELESVMDYVEDEHDRQLFVVTGEPGAGKSAFMAHCVGVCRERHADALVVPHFIGASPDSAALPTTLRSICETLRRELGLDGEVENDPVRLQAQFGELLQRSNGRSVILFIDALNQLDPAARAHELNWLPFTVPAAMKVIVSAAAGDCMDRLRRRVPEDHVVAIPAFSPEDRRPFVERFLRVRGKKLTLAQLDSLIDTGRHADAGLPLYLLVALEEICLFGEHETLSKRIDRLPDHMAALFDQVLERLEQDHGRATTGAVCGWLAASRSGLLESEVLDLLGTAGTFPRIRWTRLYRGLEPYLKPAQEDIDARSARLDFYYEAFRAAVSRRYLAMSDAATEPTPLLQGAHRQLARYFRSTGYSDEDGRWHTERPRCLSELPFHLANAGPEASQELLQTLGDLAFIEAKCAAGMAYDLVYDYQLAAPFASPPAADFRSFVASNASLFHRYPSLTFQQAILEPDGSGPATAAGAMAPKTGVHLGWMASARTTTTSHLALLTLRGHTGSIVKCAWSGDTAKILSASLDNTLRTWDSLSGKELGRSIHGSSIVVRRAGMVPESLLLRKSIAKRLEDGAEGRIADAAFSPDGHLVVSAGWDGLLRVRQAGGDLDVATLRGHADRIAACEFSPDGNALLSASFDTTLRLWAMPDGREQSILTGHTKAVVACAFHPSGSLIVSASWDGTLRLWDAMSGRVLQVLTGHGDRVETCAFSPDGTLIASGSQDGTVRLWDTSTGEMLGILITYDTHVRGCFWSPDGSMLLVSGGDDSVLLTSSGTHRTKFEAAAFGKVSPFSPDGRYVAVASGQVLHIHETAHGASCAVFRNHAARITAWAWSPDGVRIASGSREGSVLVWHVASHTPAVLEDASTQRRPLHSAMLAADRRSLCALSADTVVVFDSTTGVQRFTLRTDAAPLSAAYTPDSLYLVIVAHEAAVRRWEMATGRSAGTFEGHTDTVFTMDIAPDGNRLLTGSADRTAHLWDMRTQECLDVFLTSEKLVTRVPGVSWREDMAFGPVTACRWSPDGHQVAITRIRTDDDSSSRLTVEIVLMDLRRGRDPIRSWAHERPTGHCVWSPDGREVATVGLERILDLTRDDQQFRIAVHIATWNAHSAEKLQEMTVPGELNALSSDRDACRFLQYSPDGRTLLAVGPHRALARWDARTALRLLDLEDCLGPLDHASYSPDGSMILGFGAYGSDSFVQLWNHRSSAELAKAVIRGRPSCLAVDWLGRRLFIAYERERLQILQMRALDLGPPLVTPVRLFNHERWTFADTLAFRCPWCGERTAVPTAVLETIRDLGSNPELPVDLGTTIRTSAMLDFLAKLVSGVKADENVIEGLRLSLLEAERYVQPASEHESDARLSGNCATCGGAVRFNPFLVDATPEN